MTGHRRALVKTVTWRVVAVLTSVVVLNVFTDDIATSVEIAVVANLVSTVAYYFHERAYGE